MRDLTDTSLESALAYRITPAQAHAAIANVCSLARDADDARLIIDALGLADYLPSLAELRAS